MSIVGFTGSRNGMTEKQKEMFLTLINKINPIEFHHGCCIGSDIQAHNLLKKYVAIKRIGHPPTNDFFMEMPNDLDEIREAKPYLTRNDSIVSECNILIAAPQGKEMTRSGTWYTIRKARKASVSLYILYPDGSVLIED